MDSLLALLAARTTYLDRYVLQGGIMMVALVPTAVLALGYAVQGMISLRRGRIVRRGELEAMAEAADRGDVAGVLRAAAGGRCVAARVVAAALEAPVAGSREAATGAAREEVARLFRVIHPLAVIFNIAPYMGILGTVIGLLGTFEVYAVMASPSIADLGTGLTTALLTTIWGLSIAVPSYLFYQLFRARLIRYEEDAIPAAVERVLGPLRGAARAGSAAGIPPVVAGVPGHGAPTRYVIGDSGTFRLRDTIQPTPAPTDPPVSSESPASSKPPAGRGGAPGGDRIGEASGGAAAEAPDRRPRGAREHLTEELSVNDRPTLVPLAEEDGRAIHPENPTEEIRLP